MTRRQLIVKWLQANAYALVARTTSVIAGQQPRSTTSSLKSISRSGFPIGISADKESLQDPAIAQIVARQFNLLTVSGMKWDRIHPGPDTYSFDEADWSVRFAEEHNMLVRGHNLCWNKPSANPQWLQSTLNKTNARDLLTSHILTVMKRYKGRIDSWDVVNEPVTRWSKRSDGLYPGIWVNALGSEYLDVAFHAASAADPKALLVLNSYDVEQDTTEDEMTRNRVVALVKQLLSRGVPVQAVGLESHLDASQPLLTPSFKKFVEELKGLGLKILITELDVKETRLQGTSRDWDVAAAQYYLDYLSEVLSTVNPHSVTFWSLKDRWEEGRKIQGLFQNDFDPRLTFPAAVQALQKGSAR